MKKSNHLYRLGEFLGMQLIANLIVLVVLAVCWLIVAFIGWHFPTISPGGWVPPARAAACIVWGALQAVMIMAFFDL